MQTCIYVGFKAFTIAATHKEKNMSATQNPIATITMQNGKTIKVELYPDIAPNTVNNFIALANGGF